MGDLLLLALAGGLLTVVAASRLERALLVAVPAWLLVPAPLVVPNPLTSAATVHRAVLLGLAIAWWHHRRSAADRDGPTIPPPLRDALGGAVLGLGLLVALVVALGTTGPQAGGGAAWLQGVLAWIDRLATLALAALVTWELHRDRRTPAASWWWMRALVLALAGLAIVGGWEWVTGRAWGQLLFSPLGSLQGLDAASALELRGGAVRVRAGGEFALELAWIVLALLPAALAVAVDDPDRRWRPVGVLGVLVACPLVLTTQTRTALLALPVVVVLWVLVARLEPSPRWTGAAAGVVVAGMVVLAVGAPTLATIETDRGSVEVRESRLETLTDEVASRPITGLGVGAIDVLGLDTTDSSYVQLYGELGVIGVGILVLAVVAGLGALVPALWTPTETRPVTVACLLGVLALVAGSFAYDALTLAGSARLLWLLVGIGGAVAAADGVGATSPAVTRGRMATAGGVLVASLLIWVAMPRVASLQVRFLTVPSQLEVGEGDPVVPYGRTWAATVCQAVDVAAAESGVEARCRDEGTAAGMGRYRIAGGSPEQVVAARERVGQLVASMGAVPGYRPFTLSPPTTARPVWVATAPVTALLLGLGLLLVPTTPPAELEPPRPDRGRG